MPDHIFKEAVVSDKKKRKPYAAPICKELGNIAKLTNRKTAGARDGHKSKI